MTKIDMEIVTKLHKQILVRKADLSYAMEEYEHLSEIMTILDAWDEERKRFNSRQRFEQYIDALGKGETFKPSTAAQELGLNLKVANSLCAKLLQAGVLEKWGKGLYRRPLDKSGEARLKVITR